MSYEVTIGKTANGFVSMLIEANSGNACFEMLPVETRRLAFTLIKKANEIDHADLQAVNESGAK